MAAETSSKEPTAASSQAPGAAALFHGDEKTAQYIVLKEKLQNDMFQWAKSRFWIVSVISAIAGIFGITTIVQQAMKSAIDDTVAKLNAQASQILMKNQSEMERQRQDFVNLVRSTESSTSAMDVTRKIANEQVVAVREEIARLQTKATDIEDRFTRAVAEADMKTRRSIAEAQGQLEEFTKGAKEQVALLSAVESQSRQSDRLKNLFEQDVNFDIVEAKFSAIRNYIDERDKALRVLLDGLKLSLGSGSANAEAFGAVDNYAKQIEALNNKLQFDTAAFASNHTKKIIIYIKQDEGFFHQAHRLAVNLRRKGYIADVWRAFGDTEAEAKKDISSEFPSAKDVIYYNSSRLILEESEKQKAEDILKEARKVNLFAKLDVTYQEMKPVEKHLKRAPPRDDFFSRDIYLIYVTASPDNE